MAAWSASRACWDGEDIPKIKALDAPFWTLARVPWAG
jgi:hypothetical protein